MTVATPDWSRLSDEEKARILLSEWRAPRWTARPRAPRIRCAVCDRLVDRVQQDRVFERDVLRFRVWCHGDTDTCEISEIALVEHPELLRTEGVAFAKRRVESD